MRFSFTLIIFLLFYLYTAMGQWENTKYKTITRRTNMIVDIVTSNVKKNVWSNILCFGKLNNEFYIKLQNISCTTTIINLDREDQILGDAVRHYPNTIVVNLQDLGHYEDTMSKLIKSPFWHPLANFILYFHQENYEILPKLFFSLWYYKVVNAIIVQYEDSQEVLLISHYSPYISDDYKLDHQYGCWTSKRIDRLYSGFEQAFICEENCHNVSLNSKLRANHLGTCIGFSTFKVPYSSRILGKFDLFMDKSKNFHGFKFRAFVTEVKPFLVIDDIGKGKYKLRSRDGMIWNTMAELMNFSIDLSPSLDVIKEPFSFNLITSKVFDFASRKLDLYLYPMYLFDIIIVEVDYTFPFTDSGVCILSHRSGFETTLFNFEANSSVIIQFLTCFVCLWITFSIYQLAEKGYISQDQIGKDFLNVLRNILLITLLNPPRKHLFRLFLTVIIWSFFILNFATQATIVSFLTAVKRGKEVETFEDMINKGYPIFGVLSPDLILPDDNEKFRIINSRLVPLQDLFQCVNDIDRDSRRFCLIDCAVGRYIKRNLLNGRGEQYLHIARDRMHSHYLSRILIKHSPLTERFDKFMMAFCEAGLIKKWEQYRYNKIKEETPTRPLGMNDYKFLFNVYCFSLGFVLVVFLLELLTFYLFKKNAKLIEK